MSIPLQAACITKLRDFLMRHRKDYINSAGYILMQFTCMYMYMYTCRLHHEVQVSMGFTDRGT